MGPPGEADGHLSFREKDPSPSPRDMPWALAPVAVSGGARVA